MFDVRMHRLPRNAADLRYFWCERAAGSRKEVEFQGLSVWICFTSMYYERGTCFYMAFGHIGQVEFERL